jgi:hypothetical protein
MADQGEGGALISVDSDCMEPLDSMDWPVGEKAGLGAERSRTPPPPAQLKNNQ